LSVTLKLFVRQLNLIVITMNKTQLYKANGCKIAIVGITLLHLPILRSENDEPRKIQLKTETVIAVWHFEAIKIIALCLQPPTGGILGPFWQLIRKDYMEQPFLFKKISEENKILRLYVINHVQYSVNSISIGLLIYGIMSLCKYLKREQKSDNNAIEPTGNSL
jgi:hypothetical protein